MLLVNLRSGRLTCPSFRRAPLSTRPTLALSFHTVSCACLFTPTNTPTLQQNTPTLQRFRGSVLSSPGHNVIIGSSVHQLIGQVIREVITCHQVISGHQKVIMGWAHPRESRVDPLLEFARESLPPPHFRSTPLSTRPTRAFYPFAHHLI